MGLKGATLLSSVDANNEYAFPDVLTDGLTGASWAADKKHGYNS